MSVPAFINAREDLGRRVFSEKDARRARRSKVSHRRFLVKLGDTAISVDRLSTVADLKELVAISQVASESRDGPFCGWVSVSSKEASRNGRQVRASPVDTNPYHGEIVLPTAAANDSDERARHAQELADAARWREPPTLGGST
jgi:hypothetical protein